MKNTLYRSLVRATLKETWRALLTDEWREDAKREGPFTEGEAESRKWFSRDFTEILPLPLVVLAAAAMARDLTLYALCYPLWALALIAWTPWVLWRVSGRNPPGDTWRVAAILAHTVLPWAIVLLPMGIGWLIGFPFIYAWGGVALLLSRRRYLPAMTPPARARFILFGALAWAALSLVLGLKLVPHLLAGMRVDFAVTDSMDTALSLFGLVIAALAAILSAKLFHEAWTSRSRPMKAAADFA